MTRATFDFQRIYKFTSESDYSNQERRGERERERLTPWRVRVDAVLKMMELLGRRPSGSSWNRHRGNRRRTDGTGCRWMLMMVTCFHHSLMKNLSFFLEKKKTLGISLSSCRKFSKSNRQREDDKKKFAEEKRISRHRINKKNEDKIKSHCLLCGRRNRVFN